MTALRWEHKKWSLFPLRLKPSLHLSVLMTDSGLITFLTPTSSNSLLFNTVTLLRFE